MDPQRKGWVRVRDRAWEHQQQQQRHHHHQGEDTPPARPSNPNPPPRPPRRNGATSRVARRKPPPLSPNPAQGQAGAQGQGQRQGHPPLPNPKPPPLEDRGRDPYWNVPRVGDTEYVPWKEGGNGGPVSQVTVLGDGDEELDPGEWWVVS